jgi:trimeric autotransporter adhesin
MKPILTLILFTVLFISTINTATAQVSGLVFRDFNANGVRDVSTLITEPFVASVTVKAFDALGVQVGVTATTNASGAYSIAVPNGKAVRVEFSTLPSSTFAGVYGTGSGTTVQFATAPNSTIGLGLLGTADYDNYGYHLFSAQYVNGDPLLAGSASANLPAIIGLNYYSKKRINSATNAQVGATWGLAYANTKKQLYMASVVRRHIGFGANGVGAIYKENPYNPSTVGLCYDFGAAAGSLTSRGLGGSLTSPSYDANAFAKVGKEGLGDIDVSTDENTLYVINLFDKKLYAITLDASGNATAGSAVAVGTMPWITAAPCGAGTGVARPWAIKVMSVAGTDKVYVGGVCDASTSATNANLSAWVYEYDVATAIWNPTPRLNFPLTYTRQHQGGNSNFGTTNKWKPWTDSYTTMKSTYNIATQVGGYEEADGSGGGNYAQPILSDIEIDGSGDMILGFLDRGGMQFGAGNYTPVSPATTLVSYVSAGDVLRAGKNANGTWTIENNGITNGINGTKTTSMPNPFTINGYTPTQASGPSGREFYWGENYIGPVNGNITHWETAGGGLAYLAGRDEIVTTAMDPANSVNSGGLLWLSNTNGSKVDGTNIYAYGAAGTMAKSAGLGDIEPIPGPSIAEIGNRVWSDLDNDGIQDANELGIAGLTVTLYEGATLVATTTTDVRGQYFFNIENVTGGLKTSTAYEIRVATGQTGIIGATATFPNVNTNNTDDIDSDAMLGAGFAFINHTTPSTDAINHSLDFGFNPASSCAYNEITAGTDDGYELPTGNIAATGVDRLTRDFNIVGSSVGGTGLRFTNLNIPVGATITSANLVLTGNVDQAGGGGTGDAVAVTLNIKSVAADNTTTYNNTNFNITNRADGAATVAWSPGEFVAGATATTPDIKTLVQEVISRPGWVNGNSIAFTITTASGTGNRRFETFEGDPTMVPKLSLCYILPTGSVGNYVWNDTNGDGLNNEPASAGLNGVTVELWNATTNTQVGTSIQTMNDANGNPGYYNFVINTSGNYKIKFPIAIGTKALTTQTATAATNGNSDADTADGFSPVFAIDVNGVGTAKDNPTIDAGYKCPTTVTGCDVVIKPIRITMGTAAIATPDAEGRTFEPYTKYKLMGTLATTGNAITNTNTGGANGTSSQALYQNILYAQYLDWHFAVPNGSYTVVLHYAESYWNSGTPRKFDVYLEDIKVENDFDIYATAGNTQNKAITKTYNTTVTGSDLSVVFKKEIDNPSIAAIEIIPNFCVATQAVSIAKSSVSGCYLNASNQSKATVSVEINWANTLPTDSIKVAIGTQTRWIKPGQYKTASSIGSIIAPQVIAFEIDANGAANIITASIFNNATCTAATATLTAPVACAVALCPAVQNTALATATASSSWDANHTAAKGIDGNTNGDFGANVMFHSLIENNPWWMMEFATPQTVSAIRIWRRTDCCTNNLDGAIVEVLDAANNVLATATIADVSNSLFVTIPTPTVMGTKIRIRKVGNNHIHFSEVQVFSDQELGGTVYNDFNANGVRNSGETTGLQGITVKAFGNSGALVGTATTDKHGKYMFTPSIAATAYPLRVEFSGLPALYGQGTTKSGGAGTTTQFVAAPNCSIDLGVLNTSDYCQTNPKILLPVYISGNPLVAGSAATADAVLSFDYNSEGGLNNAVMARAPASQVGSLWGMAYNKFTKKVFSAATLKRHAGLGPLGLGGLYISDFSTVPANNTLFNYTNFIDVATIGINVGTIPTNATRNLLADKAQPSTDNPAFATIGKVGIGGIDLSEDGNKLYLTNLFDNKLYVIDLTAYNTSGTLPTAANVTSFDMSAGISCANGNLHTWAVKVNKGKVYTGMVCDASTSQNKSDLRAYVQELNGAAVTTVFDFPLTYPKGFVSDGFLSLTGWYPWTDDFATKTHTIVGITQNVHPEPMFTGIEFDIDGSMVLTFADRNGMQGGATNYGPNGGTTQYETRAAGDVLRAYATGNSFILENNAKAGPSTGFGVNNNQGPGFGEFYNENQYDNFGSGVILGHAETVVGGLALRPGSGEAIVPVIDPLDMPLGANSSLYLFAGGVRHLNNQTGINNQGFVTYNAYSTGTFGKGAGLGDVVLLCDAPKYLEIGNYVWLDANKNGVQDPAEPVMTGVKVSLYKNVAGTLTKLAETTTSVNGEYYFSTKYKLGAAWTGTGADTTLLPNQTYKVVFGESQYNAGLLTISGAKYALTQIDATANNGNDQNDSDAAETNIGGLMYPSIAVTTGALGSVNHTLDAGFICPTITNPSVAQSICLGTAGANITVKTDINTANSIKFVKFTSDQTITNGSELPNELTAIYAGTAMATVTPTGAGSPYTATYTWNATDFPNATASPTTYYVYAILANGMLCQPVQEIMITIKPLPTPSIAGGLSIMSGASTTLTASGGGTYDWDSMSSNPVRTVSPIINTVYTVTVTNNGCESSTSVTVIVTQPGSVGNYVWTDANGDGTQDGTETGINSITVELWKETAPSSGVYVFDQTTTTATNAGNDGYYNFEITTSGNYKVKFPTAIGAKTLTTQTATAATNGNSDANTVDGFSPVFVIDVNGTGTAKDNPTIDAGYVCPGGCVTITRTKTK